MGGKDNVDNTNYEDKYESQPLMYNDDKLPIYTDYKNESFGGENSKFHSIVGGYLAVTNF
jgi:hypothetical protein